MVHAVRMMAVVACLALSGCMSPQEIQAAKEAQTRADVAECEGLGFQGNSEAMGNCMLKLREIRAQERAAARPMYYGSPSVGMNWGWPQR
jgi:tRNA U38,U39,U40 pseudouridine synthase TruA